MKLERCPICGEYGFSDRHRCPPVWYAQVSEDDVHYSDDEDEDMGRVYAHHAKEAAEKFAAHWDRLEPILFDGEELRILVAPDNARDQVREFIVSALMFPRYLAREYQAAE
jgi:hypothetical protein